METIYFIIFALAFVITIPLGSRKLAYANDEEDAMDYDALRGVNSSHRVAAYVAFAVLLCMMVLYCAYKPLYIADNAMYEYLYRLNGSRTIHKELEVTFGIISRISPTFMILLAIYGLLSIGMHLYAILRNSPNIMLSTVIYMSLFFVLHDVIQIRAGVALAIMMFAIRYIYERKWQIYFPLVFLAILFHNSAVVFLPFYFMPHQNLNRYVWGGILMVALILGLLGYQIGSLSRFIPLGIIESYVESYMDNKEYAPSNTPSYMRMVARALECIIGLVMIIRYKTIQEHYPYAVICIQMFVFSEIFYLLCGDIPVLQNRMGELFGTFNIFTLAMFPMVSHKHYYILMAVPLLYAAIHIGDSLRLLLPV